jgi:hypothetical protein
MKLIILPVLALVTTFAAAAPNYAGPAYQLTHDDAQTLVAKYQSVLQMQAYNGALPTQTTQEIMSVDYKAYSDSVKSLLHQLVCASRRASVPTSEFDLPKRKMKHRC